MRERLAAAFPGLRTTHFQVTSPADPAYNCIAWAAEDMSEWWWPMEIARRTYWPAGAPSEKSIDAFVSAFLTLGYIAGLDDSVEPGFEKVALFADPAGAPTHAARQMPSARWTSKLGQSEDIEHELRALEGDIYGAVVVILKRPTRGR